MPAPSPSGPPAPCPEIAEIERALNRITYLGMRTRHHDRMRALTGITLDRAAVALLRQIADCESLRPGEIAHRLGVEASHVTRTVQQLQRAGYVARVPDPDDRRAQRIRLTDAGRRAVERIRAAGADEMRLALTGWRPEELRQLATLFHRMVDDFLAYSAQVGAGPEASAEGAG
ncbi:MarR family transcriptional regulator [Streptomyces misionensis]|uniref:MarR family transcriptional regulator n=1 Tax=Streptomyces misionensis TaxID=67331 RepID=A0A5C6IZE1_9ACTN|nr:MarR family transcriptional regulator [Streptomyces misionensis]TWV33862.1 MarR family transcriptional regulator [Streptomyces misionensis]